MKIIMPKKRSLHKMLMTRLVLVTVIISIIVVTLAVINERDRVFKVAKDRMLIRLGTLRVLILKQLDTPGLGDPMAIQEMLKSVAYKGVDLSTGHYVFVRILDPSFREVARIVDSGHDNIAALLQNANSEGFRRLSTSFEPEVIHTSVQGEKYIHARVSLTNTRGDLAAYVEGYFATSREEHQQMLLDLLRSIGIAVGIVIATSLLLYPVILRLMRRLERLSQRLIESNLETLGMLGSAIAKRDSDTDIHNFRVTIYSVHIAAVSYTHLTLPTKRIV